MIIKALHDAMSLLLFDPPLFAVLRPKNICALPTIPNA
jgi:hypothetical protein